MARNTTKNFQSAVRYMFAQRYGFTNEIGFVNTTANPGSSNVDHDFDNNKSLDWSNAADTTSISAMVVDSDNVIRVGRGCTSNPRGVQTFYLAANAGLATQCFFIADRGTLITGIEYSHATLATDSGAVTAYISHETGTQAPGAGSTTMVGTFNCKGTINTVQNATLLSPDGGGANAPMLTLVAGDRLSIVFTGTLTALAGVVVSVYTAPGFKEQNAAFVGNANALVTTQGIFLSNRDMVVSGVKMVWSTAGTDSGTVTLDVTKESSTTAPGSGTTILAAAQSAKTTANTVVSPTLSATGTVLKLAAGDRLSLKVTGATTALAGVVVMVYMQSSSLTPGTSLPYYGQVDVSYSLKANSSLVNEDVFIADQDYEVVDASFVASTAATDGGTVTADVVISKNTTAVASGTSVLSTNFNAKGTLNTVQYAGDGTVVLTVARRKRLLSQGDRLGIVYTGTLTALAGVDMTVSLLPR